MRSILRFIAVVLMGSLQAMSSEEASKMAPSGGSERAARFPRKALWETRRVSATEEDCDNFASNCKEIKLSQHTHLSAVCSAGSAPSILDLNDCLFYNSTSGTLVWMKDGNFGFFCPSITINTNNNLTADCEDNGEKKSAYIGLGDLITVYQTKLSCDCKP